MLTELNSNNWPLGVKFLIALIIVFITALCGFAKILFYKWLCDKETRNKAHDDSMVSH